MMKNEEKSYNGLVCPQCGGKLYDKHPGTAIDVGYDKEKRTKISCEACNFTHFRILD